MYDDALKFYKAVLPPSGVYYLVQIKNGKPAIHKPFNSIEEMLAALGKLDSDPNYDVYHACASYLQETVDVDGKVAWRHQTNRDKAQAFWVDVDCGADKAEEGKGYATKKEAFDAIKNFCNAVALPQPAVVDSGNGLHFYWPLTKAIPEAKWVPVAQALKAVLAHYGVLADPTRTADFASILRTPGTTNKKDPNNHKPVVLKRMVDPVPPGDFWSAIKEQVSKYELNHKQVQPKSDDVYDELTAHAYTQIDCSAEQAAQECAQMAAMRDTQGDVGYEHWFGVIGVIKHCIEGEELAVEWSSRREETGHSQTNAAYKFETWNSGPTTCAKFEACNPEGCNGCIHKGKITSPIQLGRIIPIGKAEVMEVTVGEETFKYDIPALPDGFQFKDGTLIRVVEKEGVPVITPLCNELFYLTQHIRDSDGTYRLAIKHHHARSGKTTDFQMTAADTANERDCIRALVSNSIVPKMGKDVNMGIHAYIRSSFERLKRELDEVHTYDHFGWYDNYSGILMGDRYYMSDGTVKRVLLNHSAEDCLPAFHDPIGTLAGYSEPLNYVYNRDDMRVHQYQICSVFGAPLSVFAEKTYKGLISISSGGDTGKGKTTAIWAALFGFGNAEEMTLSTKNGATLNAKYRKVGIFRNFALLFDELTDQNSDEISAQAYTIANGKEKERLTANPSGVRKAMQACWSTHILGTANSDLLATLADGQSNSQAEAVRMMNFNVDLYQMPKFDEGIDPYLQQMSRNAGCAGDVYVRYLVQNVDSLPVMVGRWMGRISEHLPEQKYRFYRSHIACTMTACEIMNKLQIAAFDPEKLFEWVIMDMRRQSQVVDEQNTLTAKSAFSQMLNEFSPQIITTQGYRDTRDARGPELTKSLSKDPVGRWIQGPKSSDNPYGGRVYIIKKKAREWLGKNRMSLPQVLEYLDGIGCLIHDKEDRFTIGRGTQHLTGSSRCFGVDYDKFLSQFSTAPSKPALKSVSTSKSDDVSKSGTDDL